MKISSYPCLQFITLLLAGGMMTGCAATVKKVPKLVKEEVVGIAKLPVDVAKSMTNVKQVPELFKSLYEIGTKPVEMAMTVVNVGEEPIFTSTGDRRGKGYASEGSYYLSVNNHEKAIEYFEKAVRQNPLSSEALTLLGWAYFGKGDYESASKTFGDLVLVDPKVVDAYTGRGWANFKKSDWAQAINYFEQALSIDSNSSDAYAGLGWCYFRKGEVEIAEKYLQRALVKGMRYQRGVHVKTEPEAHRALGYLNFSRQDFGKALKEFRMATRLKPQWNDARIKWADCLFSLKRYQEAIGIYKQALKYERNAEIYDKIGWSYLYWDNDKTAKGKNKTSRRRMKAARVMFNKALALTPSYKSSLTGLEQVDQKTNSL